MKYFTLPIIFLLSNLVTPAQAVNRVALLIGNQQYQNDKPLKNPVHDVMLIANVLQDVGFKVIKHNNLTRKQIQNALRELQNSLRVGDVALVYYSGHGLQYNNDNYLIPIDADIAVANEIPYESMSTRQLLSYMQLASTRIVILDACRNNPYKTGGKGIGKGLKRQNLETINNILIAFAAAPNEEALDGDGLNSPYAQALAENITKPGLSIESVFRKVRNQVRGRTANKQTPWYNASMDNEFYFRQGESNKLSQLAQNNLDNSEAIFWNIVSQNNTAAYYQAYLDKYGAHGLYYQFALIELSRFSTLSERTQSSELFELTVTTSPASAKVRFLNIEAEYKDHIELKPGRYQIEVSLSGYALKTKWITLGREDTVQHLVLKALPQHNVVLQPVDRNLLVSKKRKIRLNGIEMVLVDPGCFRMGSTETSNEKPMHRVCLSNGYYLGKYEVTQAQWQRVMGNNPSYFNCEQCPVENVSWDDVQNFIGKLNRQSGQLYRLPTEAEWEYAARAGTTTAFSFGRNITTDQVNYNGNYPYKGAKKGEYREKTVVVGSLPANDWGLHEMHGNVYEWVSDWYDSRYYHQSPRDDPQGPSGGVNRVFRGGGWVDKASRMRSALRDYDSPDNRYSLLGFRLALTN